MPRMDGQQTNFGLPDKCLIGTLQQLLSCLTTGVECSADLYPTERPVAKVAAVFSCKWNSLRNSLVYQSQRAFCHPVHICFSGTEIPAFDSIIKHPPDAVPVIFIILGRIDAPLGSYAMRPSWGFMKSKDLYLKSKF